MRFIWLIAYNVLFVPLLWITFNIFGPLTGKGREAFKGRRDLFKKLNKSLFAFKEKKRRVIIHSSSLGEYQQAMPLIEELEKKGYNVVATFFSPSGYNNAKLPHSGIIKTYLPLDTYPAMKKLLNIVKPSMIIFMRYDLWYNLLYIAKQKRILTILANGRYDEKDWTWGFPVLSSLKKTLYNMIDKLFVIDDEDYKNYKAKLDTDIIQTGDSKFERVLQASKNMKVQKAVDEKIITGKKIFVIGSSWKEDEEILLPVINKLSEYEPRLLTFLVPHEPKEKKIILIEKRIQEDFPNIKTIRYSNIDSYNGENLIVVDKIGILMSLYSIAYTSYVGGGFKSGLHNTLEPAVFNMPIFFSNEVKNSDEDEQLIEAGCGILVKNRDQLYKELRNILSDMNLRNSIGEKCKQVFETAAGTAERIISSL